MEFNPEPTKTFVLDIGRKCNINCRFCYYHHLGDLTKQGWEEYDDMLGVIDAGILRGDNRVEVTGGEPTIYPRMEDLVGYLKSKNIVVCIITNGIVSESVLRSLILAGTDEFLISVHGGKDTHNALTQCESARRSQDRTLSILLEANLKYGFRFNYVINVFNQNEIVDSANYMVGWRPTMVNFINMNPHHGWQDDIDTKNVVADLNIVEEQLRIAIKFLESKGIGVNVRYYPMCKIAENFRRCVCNDLQVTFDPKEWDYNIFPKTYEKHRQWGIDCSNNVEEKGEPCCFCDLQNICGGANKHFHRASKEIYGEQLIPQKIDDKFFDKQDFYIYRGCNYMTLAKTP